MGSGQTQAKRTKPTVLFAQAIAVNKLWAGEPGALLDQSKATVPMWCFQADRTTTNSTCSFAAWQVWKKALPGGAAAAMLVNNGQEVADVSVVRKTPVSRQFNTTIVCQSVKMDPFS